MADMTVEEFRARCREVAIVYRGQADELDALADRKWMPDAGQGVWEVEQIMKRTEAACETLATELESDERKPTDGRE